VAKLRQVFVADIGIAIVAGTNRDLVQLAKQPPESGTPIDRCASQIFRER
jgi:hypothetical protein